MNPVALATSTATILGAASAVGYACGYLALRARAFALGVDPTFKLVDEIYVFAGFRFFVVTLILLLITAPLLIALRAALAWGARTLPEAGQWLALSLLALATLAALSVFTVDGALLREGALAQGGLAAAVLGGATGLRVALGAGVVVLTACTALWLRARWSAHRQSAHTALLAIMLALQLFLLPVYHGALFADRRAWVLAAAPASARDLGPLLAIVDRTADQATLLGVGPSGARGLVTVARSEIDGIALREIVPLRIFLQRLGDIPKRADAGGQAPVLTGAARAAERATTAGSEGGAAPVAGWRGVIAYLGVLLDAIGSLSDEEGLAGELWTATLDPDGRLLTVGRVGAESDLSWPVIDPAGGYLALQGGRLVRLDAAGGIVAVLDARARWRRLIGVDNAGATLGLVRDGDATRLAVVAADGAVRIEPGPASVDEESAIAALTTNARGYAGDRALLVDRSARSGRGFDVYLRSASARANLSDCDPDSCVQPAFSPDFRSVAYIRAPRF